MEKRILNLGCGTETYGTDRIDFVKTSSTTKVCNFENNLPYKDNTFDEVYCKSVLEHIKNIGTLSDEIYRVLKKGGKLRLRTDYAGYLPMYIFKTHEHNKIMKYKYKSDSDGHYHLFVESHLRLLFRKFRTIKFYYFFGGRNFLFNLILKALPFKMGALHIDVIAYK